jgi:hypothetical protein
VLVILYLQSEILHFSGRLNLQSGNFVVNGGFNLSPVNDFQVISINTEFSTGISGTFNSANKRYDLEYTGNLAATPANDYTMGTELTNLVRNLTVQTTGAGVVRFPGTANSTITGNLTIKPQAFASLPSGTARTVTVQGNLIVEGNTTTPGSATVAGDQRIGTLLAGIAGNVLDLSGTNAAHSVTGAIENSANATLRVTGTGSTLSGSGSYAINRNLVGFPVEVQTTGVTVSGVSQLQQNVTVNHATANTGLTLSLINSNAASPAAPGVIGGNLVVGGGTGSATVSINANTTLAGTLITNNRATVNLANDLTVTGAPILTNNAVVATNATFASTGGFLVANNAGATISPALATIPRLRILAAANLDANMTSSVLLDVRADLGTTVATSPREITVQGNLWMTANIVNNIKVTGDNSVVNLTGHLSGAGLNSAFTRTISGTFLVESNGTVTVSSTAGSTPATHIRNLEMLRIVGVAGSGVFTQDKGNIDIGVNNLLLNHNYVYRAGTISMTSGFVHFQDNSNISLAINTNFSIRNVVNTGATSINPSGASDVGTVTVTGKLTLNTGTFTNPNRTATGNPNRLVIADGVTIERTSNTAVLSNRPDFSTATNVDYRYVATEAITAANELPAVADNGKIRDLYLQFTHAGPAANGLVLPASRAIAVKGTLTFAATNNHNLNNGTSNVTLSSGARVEFRNVNTGFTSGINTASTGYWLAYYGAKTFTSGSAGSFEARGTNYSLEANNVTVTITNNTNVVNARTVGANGKFDIGSTTFNASGDVTLASSGAIVSTTGTLGFNGTTLQTITVPSGGLTLTNNVNVNLNNPAGATLTGGNLTMGGGTANFIFTNGLFRTGTNALVLRHNTTSDQGFTRPNSGHVVGNVTKTLPTSAVTAPSNRVTFPVGAESENGSRAYSPVSFTFNDITQVPTGITMTVSHNTLVPANAVAFLGTNGFPVPDGVRPGVNLARYPDRFYWNVRTSSPLSPSLVYDMEIERENYDEYCLQPGVTCTQSDVEDMRIIRRASGSNVNNPWRLQGAANQYLQSFQTTASGKTHPTVIVQKVEGGILSGDGTIFTYALKSNLEVTAPAALVANVGQTRKVALKDVFKGGTGTYTYTVTGNDAAIATFSVANDTLTIVGAGVGVTSFNVQVKDLLNDTANATVNITVNPGLAVGTGLANVTLNLGDSTTVSTAAVFVNGTNPITLGVTSSNTAVAVGTLTGSDLKVVTTGVGTATITVTATDATGATVNNTFTVTVNATFATAGTIANVTLRAKDNLAQAAGVSRIAVASFFTGGTAPRTYTVTTPANASAVIANDTLVVTAATGTLAATPAAVTVTATDALGATRTQSFNVSVVPAYGDINADGSVDFRDAIGILQNVVGLFTPAPAVAATFADLADVDNSGTVNSFDASLVLRYGVEIIGFLPRVAPPSAPKVNTGWASLSWGDYSISKEESLVRIPLVINSDNGRDVYSMDFSADFDANQTAFESVEFTNLPEGWVSTFNTNEEGVISIALAGSTPISGGEVATITFSLLNEGSVLSLNGAGFVNSSSFFMEKLEVEQLPEVFAIEQNFPNPFNPTTNIRYALPVDADVTISVYNTIGQRVLTLVNGSVKAGTHTVTADFSRIASGVYIYRIEARAENETFIETRKMTLIK